MSTEYKDILFPLIVSIIGGLTLWRVERGSKKSDEIASKFEKIYSELNEIKLQLGKFATKEELHDLSLEYNKKIEHIQDQMNTKNVDVAMIEKDIESIKADLNKLFAQMREGA